MYDIAVSYTHLDVYKRQLVIPPLVQNLCAFLRLTDGIQHIAVALAVHCLLKSLDGEAPVSYTHLDVYKRQLMVRII